MTKRSNFIIHTEPEIDGIRKAAQAAAQVKNQLASMVRPGMSTKEIDNLASALISSTGGRSAFLGYRGYPGQICISLNDEVVHGIGSEKRLINSGDILSLDIGVELDGFIGDNAISIVVGGIATPDIERLLTGTKAALESGINAALPGKRIRDISASIEKTAKQFRLSIVEEYVGHGCGVKLHEPPEIPNYVIKKNPGPELRPGMVLAIEPMLNLGKRNVITNKDGWTVRTKDGRLSAHFEHMVLITEKYPEILTWQKM